MTEGGAHDSPRGSWLASHRRTWGSCEGRPGWPCLSRRSLAESQEAAEFSESLQAHARRSPPTLKEVSLPAVGLLLDEEAEPAAGQWRQFVDFHSSAETSSPAVSVHINLARLAFHLRWHHEALCDSPAKAKGQPHAIRRARWMASSRLELAEPTNAGSGARGGDVDGAAVCSVLRGRDPSARAGDQGRKSSAEQQS